LNLIVCNIPLARIQPHRTKWIAAMIEKRATPRHRVFKRGTIAFGGGAIDCTVRNLSETGARIEVACQVGLPPSFMLVIETDRFIRRCRSVWSADQRIGVAFEQSAGAHPDGRRPPSDLVTAAAAAQSTNADAASIASPADSD
jgi:hypothetical protein